MRKVYVLSLIMFIAAGGAFAQRTIDLSVDEIITPTQLNSNSSTGTNLSTEFVLKNNGTDDVKVGDTIIYQMVITSTSNQLITAFPSANQFAFVLATKEMKSGDTIHVNRTLNTTAYFKQSVQVRYIIQAYIRNNGTADPVSPEVAPGNANNVKYNEITWWNPQGWGVSVADVTTTNVVDVYPNPAKTDLTIDWNISNGNENREVVIYDMNGREVLRQEVTAEIFTQSINIEGLEDGMYVVKMTTGEFSTTEKLQVVH